MPTEGSCTFTKAPRDEDDAFRDRDATAVTDRDRGGVRGEDVDRRHRVGNHVARLWDLIEHQLIAVGELGLAAHTRVQVGQVDAVGVGVGDLEARVGREDAGLQVGSQADGVGVDEVGADKGRTVGLIVVEAGVGEDRDLGDGTARDDRTVLERPGAESLDLVLEDGLELRQLPRLHRDLRAEDHLVEILQLVEIVEIRRDVQVSFARHLTVSSD